MKKTKSIKQGVKIPCIFISSLMTLIIMAALFAAAGVYPFGGSTTAFADGISQYVPLLAEFAEKLKSGGSLFFSWHIGNGVNFWSIVSYYLMSPLNLISLFYSPDSMDRAFSLITLIKPCFMAVTFGIYLKYACKKCDWSTAAFSVLWAVSNFAFSQMNITSWLDALIWFPLAVMGLKMMMDGKSAWMYSLFLGLTIVSNFYIGWITCIFCVIYFVYCFIADDEVSYEGVTSKSGESGDESGNTVNIFSMIGKSYLLGSFLRFIFASLMAGGLSAVMTIPDFIALQNTGKGTITNITFNFDFDGFLSLLASHVFPLKNNYSTLSSTSAIFVYAGIVPVILCVAYFFAKGVSLRKKLGNGLLLAAMWASMIFYGISFIWHGFGEPAGIMYRFAFVYAFIILKIAFEALTSIKDIPVYGILAGVAAVAVCAACIYFASFTKVLFFSAALIAAIAVFTAVLAALLVLMSKKPKLCGALSFVLFICVAAELFTLNLSNVNCDDFSGVVEDYETVQLAKEQMDEGERLYFETSDDSYRDIIMYSALYGYNGLEEYTSMADNHFVKTVSALGGYGNRLNSENGAGEQNPVFNLAFPTDWYLDGTGRLSESSYREKTGQIEEYTLYKNNYTMPFMYTVSSDITMWNPMQFPIHIDNLNELARDISGTDGEVIYYNTPQNFSFENCFHITYDERIENLEREEHGEAADAHTNTGQDSDSEYDSFYSYLEARMNGYSYEIEDMTEAAYVTYEAVAEADGIMYIYVDTNEFTDLSITLNSETKNYYLFGNGDNRTYELGEVKKGDVATITIGGYRKNFEGEDVYIKKQGSFTSVCYTVDMEKFEQIYNALDSMSDTELLELDDTYVKANVTSYTDGMLYIPTAYDEGWTVYIDGEKAELYEHESHILMTEITAGEHVVEMKYTPAGFLPGAAVTAVCAVILIAWAVLSVKRGRREKAQGITENTGNVSEE